MGYSGAGGKLIYEKNLKSKILWHCPFRGSGKAYVIIEEHQTWQYFPPKNIYYKFLSYIL